MNELPRLGKRGTARASPWNDVAPARAELFGIERLEQHAESLARAQNIADGPIRVVPLNARLASNAAVLLAAYRASAREGEGGRAVVPAAEWLLDNYHLVEAQIREIRDDLPAGYYRQLPKLADGPFRGYPRVLGLAWAFVAHTDSHFDPETLRRFVVAYQRVQPLTIGEIWAVAITLRIVLVENLRRLADQITAGLATRAEADAVADALLAPRGAQAALAADIASRHRGPLDEGFAGQLAKRLRGEDPRTMPALDWLEERLRGQSSSVDEAIRHVQERQGASNVSVRNVITSMRRISDTDWAEFFESVSLVDARLGEHDGFAAMDFPSRNLYRSAIEDLARGSEWTELDIADHALAACRADREVAGDCAAQAAGATTDPGWHLVAGGRPALERHIGYRAAPRVWFGRLITRIGMPGYIGMILAVGALLLALSIWALGLAAPWVWLALWAIAAILPATEVAKALVDRVVTGALGATLLPGLELKSGVPTSLRTLVAVPTLLTSEHDLREQIERLEVHFLSNGGGGDLTFALLTDGLDAAEATLPTDADLLALAEAEIAALNLRLSPAPAGPRFLLLHRQRRFNAGEGVWMGWERKRGKLHELNRLLRGASDTSFAGPGGAPPWVPEGVRYVITLDADTRMPRDAAARLIGKMAHPLNRPVFDAAQGRVVEGYAILQPRVTPSLPVGHEGSLYQRIVSGPGGMDPYAAAVSDVYQDLFGEGSYTGKGIYDVDAFEAALAGRVPENALLSHDLFEGVFARAGLVTDVELVEEFPARYDVAVKRQHRWARGDWQLLPWILGRRGGLPEIGRGKMLDNLRRSVQGPFMLAMLFAGWQLPQPAASVVTLLVLAAMAIPAFLPAMLSIVPRRSGIRLGRHLGALAADLRLVALRSGLDVALLADQSWRMLDAIARALTRLLVTHRHMLEWTTAAQTSGAPRPGLSGYTRGMAGGMALGSGIAAGAVALTPTSWPLALPFAALWLGAPALALLVSRAPRPAARAALSPDEASALRLIARRTWRYFETFANASENMLPPDNFQEDPQPVVAHRTSPTNLGLYLLSTVAARDFGWADASATVERLEATLGTMKRMPKQRGHFYNWYDTRDLRVLDPAYVSSVDSGNLAGHLIVLANACEDFAAGPVAEDARTGLHDTLRLGQAAVAALPNGSKSAAAAILAEIGEKIEGAQPLAGLLPVLARLAKKAASDAESLLPAGGSTADVPDLMFWIGALRAGIDGHARDLALDSGNVTKLAARYTALAAVARGMAMAMDFAFLLDAERKLLSIGYSAADNRLDGNCYDLLASEARLASLIAIAKGDLPTRHWFRLGRSATPMGSGLALISWSGSMFEYLMPVLVVREPEGSLLAQTDRLVVARQQAYGRERGVPWGISESAFNARDLEFTYQYSNFGVPGLGLKRGLASNLVVAPYATGLAAMLDAPGACKNFARLSDLGGVGRYGFYEALDFTKARVPEGKRVAIVRNFMAHHQGMTIAAIANVLQDGRMRARFHREPMIRAVELLLHERMPRDVAVAHPRAEEVKLAAAEPDPGLPLMRRYVGPLPCAPVTQLMSNGRYAVMLSASGGGYSRWGEIAVTRWREDATRDDSGTFVYIKDTATGAVWSATPHPMAGQAKHAEVQFFEDRAEFIRRDGSLSTVLDVLVSGEDDGEVRRLSLSNSGRHEREIEVTSYSELALTTPATDLAHPAFAKLFVQTEFLPEYSALIATRRPRSPDEPPIWAAHFAVVEGDAIGAPEYETDRARFIGRGRTAASPAGMDNMVLSNTTGTVLDPVFALRQRLRIKPGETARVAFWTVVAASREALIDLIDQHCDRAAFVRARTLAWTQGEVQLRHLGVGAQEAADFQRLAAPILYIDPRWRPSRATLARGIGPQAGLWSLAISGDLPIVLLRIDSTMDMAQVLQLLRAHEYWRMKGLAVDLVIINEHPSSYIQDLQTAIEAAVRRSQSRPRFGVTPAQGAVFALRADLMSPEARDLVAASARVVLAARRGCLAEQLALLPVAPAPPAIAPEDGTQAEPSSAPLPDLEFFNGLGGFDRDGRDYVIVLDGEATTPTPWINVVANAGFGFQASATGSGYTWSENSRENQLTAWSNDPVIDPPGEAFFVRDSETGQLWSPTAQPIRDGGRYVARHGFGFCRFEHEAHGIALDLLQYVPLDDPVKISRLTLINRSARRRRLSVTAYAGWVLGSSRSASAQHVITEIDAATGALLARNPWSTAFPGRIAFADLGGKQTSSTGDGTAFLGQGGGLHAPAALRSGQPLSGATGAGYDPCAALSREVELAPGQSVEVVFLLGQGDSADAVRGLIERYRAADLDAVLRQVGDHWAGILGAVQVTTPDRAMDIMLNGWLLYQTVACRIRARAAFYQASGAYGFRDQLQDGMALSLALPQETRAQILRAASRQFVEGDVQHWWLPHSGQGVRSRISDDRVWLAFATATYVGATGDGAVLDEPVPFIEGPVLEPGAHDAFFQPMPADVSASLFEHCARGLDQCLELTGPRGLPLMGTGDWNDGMNRVGEAGRGESVWLGWLLFRTLSLFAPLAAERDPERAQRWQDHAAKLRSAMERHAWDGAWYRRASYDDGSWLGSVEAAECQIDSIAQSWAVLSGAADPARAALAMAALDRELIRRDDRLVLLFAPPFDHAPEDPGYIKGYPPGLRENGGQYSHAAMWAILAFAEMGEGDRAAELFALLNPINHARTPSEVAQYKVEPYVVAADVYSVAPHVGRGGWTWYTGSAAWMYRAGIEGILGLHREGDFLVVRPRLPTVWPGFQASVTLGAARLDIRVEGPCNSATLDGADVEYRQGQVRVRLEAGRHVLWIGTTPNH